MKKRIIVVFLAIAIISLLIAISFFRKENSNNGNTNRVSFSLKKEKGWFIIANRQTEISRSSVDELDNSSSPSEEDEDENYIRQWASSDEEIKRAALLIVRNLYGDFDDMDFSKAVPAEMVFVQNTKPGDESPGYYLVALRNPDNEMMARAVLNLLKEKDGKKLLESGNVEPFPPSFTDPETQAEYRKAEKYPLTDPLPRISEGMAVELAREKLGEDFHSEGLTNIFLYLPSLESDYQIGVPFSPYYKFSVDGDNEKTIWVNSETGVVIGVQYLEKQAEDFEKMMEEERFKPLPPMEEPGGSNDD